MCISLNAEDIADKRAIFMQFQNFYEALHPAQEKNENAYAWFSNIPLCIKWKSNIQHTANSYKCAQQTQNFNDEPCVK